MTALDRIIANAAAVKAALPADRHDDVISVGYYDLASAHIEGAPLPGATFSAPNYAASPKYPVRWEATVGGVDFVGWLTRDEAAAIPEAAALLTVPA